MRFLTAITIFFLFSGLTAQPDTLLTATLWEETTTDEGAGNLLFIDDNGNFEVDKGAHLRRGRYLQGRWSVDSTGQLLTLAVDGLLGQGMLPRRYKRGRDFYLEYEITAITCDSLALVDVISGKERTFKSRERGDYISPAERVLMTAPQPKLELPKKGKF